jgi:hypothetical protein
LSAGRRPLWDGYNRFYGRHGSSALPESISEATWERFFSREEQVHALVAEQEGRVIGIALSRASGSIPPTRNYVGPIDRQ